MRARRRGSRVEPAWSLPATVRGGLALSHVSIAGVEVVAYVLLFGPVVGLPLARTHPVRAIVFLFDGDVRGHLVFGNSKFDAGCAALRRAVERRVVVEVEAPPALVRWVDRPVFERGGGS